MDKTDKSSNKGWILHLIIVIAMYTYYLSLWYDFIFYDGKAGWNGFEIFTITLLTAPFYFLFHIIAFFISRSNGFKKDKAISVAGLGLCILHACAVLATL